MIQPRHPIRTLADFGREPGVHAFLLGEIDFHRCVALQQRLVDEAYSRADGRIALLLCEHPPIITIGRGGSRSDVQLRDVQLAGRTIDVVRVGRGGGTLLHLPGQLAVYPIVPLADLGWSVGEFLGRFQNGLQDALQELGVAGRRREGQFGVWGETGQLASIGVGVKHWITYHGAQINILPPLHLFQYVVTDPVAGSRIGSVADELRHGVRMAQVRSRVVRSVSEALGSTGYHLFTGHPLLSQIGRKPFAKARAS